MKVFFTHAVLTLQNNNGKFLVFQINMYNIQIILSTHANKKKTSTNYSYHYLARKPGLCVLKIVWRLDWWCLKISHCSSKKSDDDDEWHLLSGVTLYSLSPVIEETTDKCLRTISHDSQNFKSFIYFEKKKDLKKKNQMFDWLKMHDVRFEFK